MIGYVVVRPKGKSIPSKKLDVATLKSEVKAQGVAAAKLVKTTQPADHVSLGESDSLGLELYSMFPATLSVNAGTTVTFSMSSDSREVHTASFGPTAYLTQLSNGVGPPGPATQEALYPSDSPALGPIPVTPTSHGNGFANSGGLDVDTTTPLPTSTKFTFTTTGTYHFVCLIHPFMHGTIIVH
jgi:plastocyanin